MATRPKFAKMANYSCECVECESHFSRNDLWRMSANVSSPGKRVGECRSNESSPGKRVGQCRSNVSSPGKRVGECRANVSSPTHLPKKEHFGEYSNSTNSLKPTHSPNIER
jgi:hypothetical protein